MSTTILSMSTRNPDRKLDRSLTEILTWWLMLAAIAVGALLIHVTPARAQQTGPLPPATPSDEPPPSPRSSAPKLIGGKPNIGGTWALNKDASDDPRQAMREAMGNRGGGNVNGNGGNGGGGNGGGGPRIGMGGGGGGWGGRGGNGGGNGGGGRRGGQNGAANPADDLNQLTIAQDAKSATVTSESGHIIAQYSADNASPSPSASSQSEPHMKNSTPGASTSTNSSNGSSSAAGSSTGDENAASTNGTAGSPPVAQWQGAQLIAITPGRRQGTTTRTYELSPDGRQLYVTTKIDNPRFDSPVTFRLVYDPVQASE